MELVTTYLKHGWDLKGALMQPSTRAEISAVKPDLATEITIKDSSVDGLWFSRPSHQDRVAWELRLLSETQYALFETFEPEETEEEREEMKLEMEAKLRDYVTGSPVERGH